jgi:hypothetical protein
VRLEGLKPVKNPYGPIESRNRSLLVRSAVPQLNAPPRIPPTTSASQNITVGRETKVKLINICLYREENFGS